MTISHLRRKTSRFGNAHLAIAVFPSPSTAFMAYRLLHYHGISPENLALVGEGYSKPEWVGLVEPKRMARQRAKACAFLGCIAASTVAFAAVGLLHSRYGQSIDLAMALMIPAFALVGGALGAGAGALIGRISEMGRLNIYRHHLRQGHYLLMIEGDEALVRLSQDVLGQYASPKPSAKSSQSSK
ncbi:MAG: hypothetical protein HC824_17505 [Synechococcales cyanobacterium RM1_1_8]|nr:hypothetical protein [Synechococcales cyanobacterium RM1_1_8]